ncbi:hypothetical protein D8674_000525 [Pyrus ussuriensis x Pyrus communis]|uniref:Uncharacterized protein n=1 Tax=Pyrus ussuriensis x Pyrus communis TaxID=2448454 RepID=A0A5N5F3R2_9ROSA|nr:hypothetical protein D8674_000525 [Pyrus ussuriensis x Pyrus communis]
MYHIVEKHHLGVGDVVQVWSVRANPEENRDNDDNYDSDEFHLVFVLVKRRDHIPEEDGRKESTSTNGGSSSTTPNELQLSVELVKIVNFVSVWPIDNEKYIFVFVAGSRKRIISDEVYGKHSRLEQCGSNSKPSAGRLLPSIESSHSLITSLQRQQK